MKNKSMKLKFYANLNCFVYLFFKSGSLTLSSETDTRVNETVVQQNSNTNEKLKDPSNNERRVVYSFPSPGPKPSHVSVVKSSIKQVWKNISRGV